MVDTGASVSLIKREIVDRLPKSTIACSKVADISVQDANGKTIVISDIIYIYFELCGRKLLAPFHVLELGNKISVGILLGINILRSENILIDLPGKKLKHVCGGYSNLLERNEAVAFSNGVFCCRKTMQPLVNRKRVVIQPYESLKIEGYNKNVRR